MKTALIFVTFLMSLSIAQMVSLPSSKSQKKSTNDASLSAEDSSGKIVPGEEDKNQEGNLISYSDDESDDEGEDFPQTTLACSIFSGDNACKAMCSMVGSIYGHVINPGTCQNEFDCDCSMPTDATLDDLWNAKFIAKSVLKEIHDDEKLSKEVPNILRKPLRTREQTLQDLRSILTSEQLRNIKVKDTIAKVLNIEDQPDKKALGKYVAKKLASFGVRLQDHVSLNRLDDLFKTAPKQSTARIIREVRRSDNARLNTYINGLIKQHEIREPTKDTYARETFLKVLDTAIANNALLPRSPKSLTREPSPSSQSCPSPGTA